MNTLIQADIRDLEKKKKELTLQIERMQRAVTGTQKSIQSMQISAELKLLEKKRTDLLAQIERVSKQVKPILMQVEQLRAEGVILQKNIREYKDKIVIASKEYEALKEKTDTYTDAEYKKLEDKKRTMAQDIVKAYERIEADRMTIKNREAELARQTEVVSRLGQINKTHELELVDREKEIEFDWKKTQDLLDDTLKKHREQNDSLIEQKKLEEQVREKARTVYVECETIKQEADEKMRLASHTHGQVERERLELEEAQDRLKIKETELILKEKQLQDKEETLKRTVELLKTKGIYI